MLAHRRVQRLLGAWVDNETRGRLDAAMSEHVGGCPDCTRQALLIAAIKQALRTRHGRVRAS